MAPGVLAPDSIQLSHLYGRYFRSFSPTPRHLAKAESPGAGYTGIHPGGFQMSPEREIA